MKYPIIGLCGPSGCGKDTVAQMLCKDELGVMIAQADVMKRFLKQVLGFSDETLWGPSSARNNPEGRFKSPDTWKEVHDNLNRYCHEFCKEVGIFDQRPIRALFADLEHQGSRDGLNARRPLQLLGTEVGRVSSPDIWSKYALDVARKALTGGYMYDRAQGLIRKDGFLGYDFAVINDLRFRNELLNIKELGGTVVKILNPKDESAAVDTAGVRGHASEAQLKNIPDEWFDFYILNDKSRGLEKLRADVASLGRQVFTHSTFVYGTPRSQS